MYPVCKNTSGVSPGRSLSNSWSGAVRAIISRRDSPACLRGEGSAALAESPQRCVDCDKRRAAADPFAVASGATSLLIQFADLTGRVGLTIAGPYHDRGGLRLAFVDRPHP
ncbi:hypothetical protein EMIT0158MI4_20628 [Burkholderia ambifaria]